MGYDFISLSSVDFEELVRDLLQAETGHRYEIFKAGRDQGIDLRYKDKNNTTIVQCKHYVRSGFPKLLHVLKNEELEKIKKINPQRYIIATSLPLSVGNKDEIQKALHPFVKSLSDIIGQEDLNNFLRLHPEIEKKHFKLWLASKAILDRVLHNAIITQSEQLINKAKEKIPLFVQNRSFTDALKILNKNRFIIISGEPGVGKTTLAEMLLLSYLGRQYRAINVHSPRDAYDLYSPDINTIYYYDDFLGLTHLGDSFSQSTAEYIVRLIDLVSGSQNTRMILTSREFVLQQAAQHNERFAHNDFLGARYRLKLEHYTNSLKARILYNHLYFSDLDNSFLDEIVSTETYKKIIKHPNYMPRLIEWMTKASFLRGVDKTQYPAKFIQTLNSPLKLWEHPFRQISHAGRHLLMSILFLKPSHSNLRLQSVFREHHTFSCSKYGLSFSPQDFNYATKELVGSFLKINNQTLLFHNPSIKDFLENLVVKNSEICFDILESAVYVEQLVNIWELFKSQNSSTFSPLHKESTLTAINRLKFNPPFKKEERYGATFLATNDINYHERISFFVGLHLNDQNKKLLEIISEILDIAFKSEYPKNEISLWAKLSIEIKPHADAGILPYTLIESIQKIVVKNFDETLSIDNFLDINSAINKGAFQKSLLTPLKDNFESYIAMDASDEYRGISSSEALAEYLSSLESVAQTLNVDIEIETSTIQDLISEAEEHEKKEADDDNDTYFEDKLEARFEEEMAIDSMFEGLQDR